MSDTGRANMDENGIQTKIVCPECGVSIEADSAVCTECGFPLKSSKPETSTVSKGLKLPKMQLGVVLCVIAVICFIVGVKRIANDDYAFYTEHYKECVEGYEDAKREAKDAGWLLKSGYERITDTYEDMMDDDLKKIWQYRIGAIVLCSTGVILAFFGIKNMRDDKEGSDGTV